MQRAAIRATLVAVRRAPPLLIRAPQTSTLSRVISSSALALRSLSTTPAVSLSRANAISQGPATIAHKSGGIMHIRSLTAALFSTIVLGGAWWSIRDPELDATTVPLDGRNGTNTGERTGGKSFSSLTSSLRSAETASFGSGAPGAAAAANTEESAGRRVVAVDQDTLYLGTIKDDGPLAKQDQSAVHTMLTPEEATAKLRRSEESFLVGREKGVWRYDVVQVASNNPIEDDHAEKFVEVPATTGDQGADWMFWGVFDGHSGWTTSAKLRQTLIGYVARELNQTFKSGQGGSLPGLPSPEAIDDAMKKGFLKLDHEIVHGSVEKVLKNPQKSFAAETLQPALSGSCALLAFYESRSKILRVACTGDSRAVLGRRGVNGKWSAEALSVDQTGSNPDEEARIRSEHPGEKYAIHHGRVLGGLEPTRAFGDSDYKWPVDIQNKIRTSFFGRSPRQYFKSPPYVTAEPVVTQTKISPENGDFLVLATDGLWEMLTNEEVVGLVGRWLEDRKAEGKVPKQSATPSGQTGAWLRSWFQGQDSNVLPIEIGTMNGKNGQSKDAGGQKMPVRVQQYGTADRSQSEKFVFEDQNAATHLVRNALGGKDRELVCALLTLPSPWSRRYRDDLTVEVIFFGEGDASGKVAVNTEATASKNTKDAPEAKAKL